jgi:L-ascorbate metabolism protein UlaG (beta-lactamase superfamily)
MKYIFFFCLWFFFLTVLADAADGKNTPDTITTKKGKLIIHCINHASLLLDYQGLKIYADPIAQNADLSTMPKADIILITHSHSDHLDGEVIRHLKKDGTQIVLNKSSFDILKSGLVMANGESKTIKGILIEAVPAYNTTPDHEKFHPKGRDNGYILTLGGKRIYIAGDTEDIPEMKKLTDIDIAFLPMNLPWTMSPEQVANSVKTFMPKILYPYHYGDTNPSRLTELLKDTKNIEIRIKNMD